MPNSWTRFANNVTEFLPELLTGLIIVAIGWGVSNLSRRICARALRRAERDATVVSFLSSAVAVMVKVVAVIMALSTLGLNTNVIVGGFSALGVGISLALKNNMANVACGIQMLFTKPFLAGDYIAAEDVEGTVERIDLMFTTLRTSDNKVVILPNSSLCESIIINYTRTETRRLDLSYGISYEDDLEGAKVLLRGLLQAEPRVLAEPAPLVAVDKHGDSAVILAVHIWCKNEDYWDLYYAMQERVKLAFDEHGYHIPYPQMDIHNLADNAGKAAV